MKPPRNQRCVGRNLRGKKFWKKQILPQLVPMAPVMNMLILRIDFANLLRAGMGSLENSLYLRTEKRPNTTVKNLATLGKAWR